MYLDEITIWDTTPSEYFNEIKISDTTTNIYGITFFNFFNVSRK